MSRDVKPIAVNKEVCACCRKLKMCGMYVLQDGTAAWVCVQCREGR